MPPTDDDFHLLDLASQAYAVQKLLQGRPTEAKLAGLAEHGDLSLQHHGGRFPDSYLFRSHVGLETLFSFMRTSLSLSATTPLGPSTHQLDGRI